MSSNGGLGIVIITIIVTITTIVVVIVIVVAIIRRSPSSSPSPSWPSPSLAHPVTLSHDSGNCCGGEAAVHMGLDLPDTEGRLVKARHRQGLPSATAQLLRTRAGTRPEGRVLGQMCRTRARDKHGLLSKNDSRSGSWQRCYHHDRASQLVTRVGLIMNLLAN